MKTLARFLFPAVIMIIIAACSSKSTNQAAAPLQEGKGELLKKVSYYSDDTTIAVTYYSADTNWTELAKALWQEKTKLLAGKDSSTIYYLIVFKELDKTPDIASDYNIAWDDAFTDYRLCTMDNGMMFTRFCYGVRYDMGRIGDWAHMRTVNQDGSLAEDE